VKRHVLCYDVADDRRRRRVARSLEDVGDRVQESVFEADLDATLFDKVNRKVAAIIDAETDAVVVYPLCNACARRRRDWGRPTSTPLWGDEVVIVV
jgi:CRISPR-associated protein Cas2